MKASVAKHYGCKRAKHRGLIANGRSQANRNFSCVRNMNCCVARLMPHDCFELLLFQASGPESQTSGSASGRETTCLARSRSPPRDSSGDCGWVTCTVTWRATSAWATRTASGAAGRNLRSASWTWSWRHTVTRSSTRSSATSRTTAPCGTKCPDMTPTHRKSFSRTSSNQPTSLPVRSSGCGLAKTWMVCTRRETVGRRAPSSLRGTCKGPGQTPRKIHFFAVRSPRFWVSGYRTKWRIQDSFHSSYSHLLNVKI